MKPYCNSEGYKACKKDCPVTCRTRRSSENSGNIGNEGSYGDCEDTLKNCISRYDQCNEPQYLFTTTKYCRKTCVFC
ncbi:hypothetical protein L596_017166 [Steinernema carpocapsae]|uniref:ShKT domain-containing protein n=1 Tax=Steinernema carpocapsae TaxID=34508 RepID=A0A4U5N132_STECR|nr:hypothetical protein L596_017166 [Steinernema carpocapsae]